MFNYYTMTYSTLIVLIDNNQVFNHTTNNELSVSKGYYRFIAQNQMNKICFDSAFNVDIYSFPYAGPALDNVTPVKLSPNFEKCSIFCNRYLYAHHSFIMMNFSNAIFDKIDFFI